MREALAFLDKTDTGVRRVGASAAAIMAIVAFAVFLLGAGKSTHPLRAEASIGEVSVEPGVLLEQYEFNNPPAGRASASDESPAHADRRLAVDSSHAPATTAIYLASAQIGTEDTSTAGTSTGGTSTTETPAQEAAREAAQAKAREQARASEEAKAMEAAKAKEEALAKEALAKEALAKETKVEEEARAQEERTRAQAEEANAKVRARARQEARAQIEEQDRLLAQEKAKIAREEREEDSLSASRHRHAAGASGARPSQSYAAPPPPPPPATPFHRSGNAKILVGTGAPTSKVDAVLGKARAILARRDAAFARADAAFGAGQPVFRDVSTGAPSATPPAPTTASSVPATCASTCGLRPTIDQAIADYSLNLAAAARAVAAAFGESRDEIFEHKAVPVGVTVNYSLDLAGFAGKRMVLEWTLCSRSTERPLPRTWWRNVIVKQIVPTSNSPTRVPGNFWAPIPATRGDYYFRLRVFEGSSEHTNRVTEAFH